MEPVTMALLFGANMGLGAMRAAQAAKQRQAEANIRAAEIEASPWTGKAPSTQVSTQSLNPWAEMAGGAINAAGQAAALENAGLFKSSSDMGDEAIKKMADATKVTGSGEGLSLTKLTPYQQTYNQQNASFLNPWQQMSMSSSSGR